MSRDVTHHHNRERERPVIMSSYIRNCITARGGSGNWIVWDVWGESEYIHFMFVLMFIEINTILHFFKLQTLLVGFLCPSCCLHKLPLFGPFPGPCGMIPPFVPVWSNEGGAASSEHDWRSRDSCCEEKGSCRVQRSFKWRKLLSWRARVDQCGLILT